MIGDTTIIAAIALIIWPVVTIALFFTLGPVRGFIWSLLVGYLFLPARVGFDLPLLPAYTKYEAISYSMLLAILLAGQSRTKAPDFKLAAPGTRTLLLCLTGVLLLMPAMTFITNRDGVVMNGATLLGLGIPDYLVMMSNVVVPLIPFFIARRWLATPENHTKFLTVLVMLAFGYSLLAIFEVRMSPQLNRWFYGYFPHDWLQHIRGSSFRPIIFLNHGLSVGLFLFMATVAVVALFVVRRASTNSASLLMAGAFILGASLISRNLGAILLTFIFVPLLLFRTRTQTFVISTVAFIFIAFPVIRYYAPIEGLTDSFAGIAPERAYSLQYRLDNEAILLDRANERPVFGWGIWGRPLIYNDWGMRTSTTDGTWILIFGTYGWVGYLAYFGVIVVPLMALRRAARRKAVPIQTMALAMMGTGNLIYLIPNSTLTPLSWALFGAIAGFVERDVKDEAAAREPSAEPEMDRTRYTRFGPGSTAAPGTLARNVSMTTHRKTAEATRPRTPTYRR